MAARILETCDHLQAYPQIGRMRPDVTEEPLLFFPARDDVIIVYRVDPFAIMFVLPPGAEPGTTLRRRLAQP